MRSPARVGPPIEILLVLSAAVYHSWFKVLLVLLAHALVPRLEYVAAAELESIALASLPPNVREAFDKSPEAKLYAISTSINPYYLHGDFNGDGQFDTAILVVERRTGKKGVVIIHGGSRRLHLFGAGRDWGNGSDDFPGLSAWYVYRRGQVDQGATDKLPPRLVASALMLIKTESASALLYWDGKRYRWYQQGD